MLKLLVAAAFLMSPTDLETGRSLRQEGRLEEAIEHFEGMLASQPGDPETQLELGHSLALAGHYDRAYAAYTKIGESDDPKWRIESSKWRGLTHLYRGEISKAVAELDRQAEIARQANDRTGEVFTTWYRGHIRTVLAQFGKANQVFLEALELAPNDFNVLHLAGVMAAHQGDEGSLRYQAQDLEQMVRRSGERSQMRRVYHLQAEVSLLQDKPEKALREIKKALELSSHPLYHEAAARIHLALDDPSAAEESYRNIVTSADKRLDIPLYYPKALIGLARALVDQEKKDEALPYYEKFLDLWGAAPESLPEVEDARSQYRELSAMH